MSGNTAWSSRLAAGALIVSCRGDAPPAPAPSYDANVSAVEASSAPSGSAAAQAPDALDASSTSDGGLLVELDASEVADCVSFTSKPIPPTAKTLNLQLEAKATKSTGDCGCTSAALHFQVLQDVASATLQE